ncbi:hypothetical protein PG987_010236 [Apiospora arundinis]
MAEICCGHVITAESLNGLVNLYLINTDFMQNYLAEMTSVRASPSLTAGWPPISDGLRPSIAFASIVGCLYKEERD